MKITMRPFLAENGDLYGEVQDGGYCGPKRGEKILLHTRQELDEAENKLKKLVELTNAGADISEICKAVS